MPKAYIIARADFIDPEAYARYAAGATEAMKKYGGKPFWRAAAAMRRSKARRGRAMSCSSSRATTRRAPISIRRNTRTPESEREGAARWRLVLVEGADMAKGYWIAHVDVADPEAYKAYLRPTRSPSPNLAPASWCAAASGEIKEGGLRPAMS